MRVLMLGWEFPPFISGGLGTACYGLTKALSGIGQDVMFVLPRPVATPFSTHVKLVSAHAGSSLAMPATEYRLDEFERVNFRSVESTEPIDSGAHQPFWSGPYDRPEGSEPSSTVGGEKAKATTTTVETRTVQKVIEERVKEIRATAVSAASHGGSGPSEGQVHTGDTAPPPPGSHYAGDLFAEVQRYAHLASEVAKKEQFDVIHAHDWMTYPAGLAVAAASGKPLVVHVHSTEFDRAGLHVDQRIYDIERRGMHAAVKVIAVSHLTKNLCVHHYGVEPENIEVVHNAIEFAGNGNGNSASYDAEKYKIHENEKIVLFLGRITMQKGPEYFLAAAKKVLEVMPNVKFVMAGSGDMVRRTIEMAAQMGIGHKVLFTGFLRGADVERVFKMADLYVMPSVSEPFGIAPLEAMSNDVPVIISKQSGVSEVLQHALKVDFWDVGEMANKIVAVLRHPPLSAVLKSHGSFEVKKLSWTDAAKACVHVYEAAIASVPTPVVAG
jgi:glycosyltransferase involved in cell wall biosynthesis